MKASEGLTELDKEYARRSLLKFTEYTKEDYVTNWHHALLCEKLDDFYKGKIKRLMVSMPPRMGKSELVSRRFPAYVYGKDPNASIISCSYGSDLSSRMNRDVQRIMDSPAYQDLFPDTQLFGKNIRTVASGSYLRNSEIFEIVNYEGVYRSAGVGGAITGMGGKFLLIDDPIKNFEEAYSAVYREKVWEWYISTLYTRLERDGGILLTMTRWHDDDLAGRLLEAAKEGGEKWEILNLPHIAEAGCHPKDPREVGESLWPWKYPDETVAQMKITSGSKVWNAMHQQRPAPESGNIVNRNWWKYYKQRPSNFDWVMTSWDFTFKDTKGSDYVCGQVWGKKGADKFLLDQVRDRMGFTESVAAMKLMYAKWKHLVTETLVEDKANGPAIMDTLRKEIPALVAYNPQGSKVARAHAISPQIEAGNIYIPDPSIAAWVPDYVEEWAVFPNGKHDDSVDATSQAITRIDNQFGYLGSIIGTEHQQREQHAVNPELVNAFWGER